MGDATCTGKKAHAGAFGDWPWPSLRRILFADGSLQQPRWLQGAELASFADCRITFSGFQLDQSDLDVYERVLGLARLASTGDVAEFDTADLLRQAGRSTDEHAHEWLWASLDRLVAGAVTLNAKGVSYTGRLVVDRECVSEGTRARHWCRVRLNPLFAGIWA